MRFEGLEMFGEIISRRRHDLELTQQHVAVAVKVAPSTISSWERGKIQRLPPPELFHRLCKALVLKAPEVLEETEYWNLRAWANFRRPRSLRALRDRAAVRSDRGERRRARMARAVA